MAYSSKNPKVTTINKVTITQPSSAATLTLSNGSTLATSGGHSCTLTTTGSTNVTLPTTGTASTLGGVETFTNKTLTSPKLNEDVALTTTSTKLNYLTSATGSTGTTSTNVVFSGSPTLTTPNIGAATGTSLTVTAHLSSGNAGWWHSFNSSSTADDGSETFTFPSSNFVMAFLGTGGTSGSSGNIENYLGFARGASWVTDVSIGANVQSFSSDPTLSGVTDGKIGVCFVDATTLKIYNRRGAVRSFTVHVFGR